MSQCPSVGKSKGHHRSISSQSSSASEVILQCLSHGQEHTERSNAQQLGSNHLLSSKSPQTSPIQDDSSFFKRKISAGITDANSLIKIEGLPRELAIGGPEDISPTAQDEDDLSSASSQEHVKRRSSSKGTLFTALPRRPLGQFQKPRKPHKSLPASVESWVAGGVPVRPNNDHLPDNLEGSFTNQQGNRPILT